MSPQRMTSGEVVGEHARVAVAGIVLTRPLAPFLEGGVDRLPPGTGGASAAVWQLVVALLERGQHMSVVTLDESVQQPVVAGGPLLDLVMGPLRHRHGMRDLMRLERRAVQHGLTRVRADLVHAHWCGEYALGAIATGLPTLVTVHDWMPAVLRMTEPRYWPYWSGKTALYFMTLARARYMTANSPYTAAKVRQFTRAPLEVVPNGVADEWFLPMDGGEASVRSDTQDRVVVSVNNGFSPRKNVKRLLRAVQVVRRAGVDCTLQLIGDGYGLGGPCQAWARRERLTDGVTFLGRLSHEEVMRSIRRSAVLAHPAREEAFGMTLVEAMSQRVPVLAGVRSGAVPWVLGAGRAGVLVNVDEVTSLAEGLTALLTQPGLRKRLAHEGYEHAWNNYRQSRVADLYVDAYRRVLAETERSR